MESVYIYIKNGLQTRKSNEGVGLSSHFSFPLMHISDGFHFSDGLTGYLQRIIQNHLNEYDSLYYCLSKMWTPKNIFYSILYYMVFLLWILLHMILLYYYNIWSFYCGYYDIQMMLVGQRDVSWRKPKNAPSRNHSSFGPTTIFL